MPFLKSFFFDEDGAVTVDWVILTAGVVAVAVLVAGTMTSPVNNELNGIAAVVER